MYCLHHTVAHQTKASVSTIQFYESVGLLELKIMENGEKYCSRSEILRFHFLEKAFRAGFSVEECQKLMAVYGSYISTGKEGDMQ